MFTALGIFYSLMIALVALVCWIASALGLPGLWVLVGIAVLDAWLIPESYMANLPWWSVLAVTLLAGLGELIEFAAGALGVGRLGGSRRSAVLALVGSLVGAIVGFVVSLPIPIIGPIVGSVLFSALGALIGAWIGEHWVGSDQTKSLKVGVAAFFGRIFGTIGKSICGAIMVAIVVVLAFT